MKDALLLPRRDYSRRGLSTAFIVLSVLLVGSPEVFSAGEPWGHLPRGKATRIWSWGSRDPSDDVGRPTTSEIKATLILDATVEHSGGRPTSIAVSDTGYLFVLDRTRDCLLRWNPEGKLDRLFYSETAKDTIREAFKTASPEIFTPRASRFDMPKYGEIARAMLSAATQTAGVIESAPFSFISDIVCDGERLYAGVLIGEQHLREPLPRSLPNDNHLRLPFHIGVRVFDLDGRLLSDWCRMANWHEPERLCGISTGGKSVIWDHRGYTCYLGIYSPKGTIIRRIMVTGDKERENFINPEGPVELRSGIPRPTKDPDLIADYDKEVKKVREDRIIMRDIIAAEVADGSPPFEIKYLRDLPKTPTWIGFSDDGNPLVISDRGEVLLFDGKLNPTIRKIDSDSGGYGCYHQGIILRFPQQKNEILFAGMDGEPIMRYKLPDDIVLSNYTQVAVDVHWNVFFISGFAHPTLRGSPSLCVYRPTEKELRALRDASRR